VFAAAGVVGSEAALWVAASSVNVITVTFGVLAAAPFIAYAVATRSKLASALGGPLLLGLPVVAYGDTYFGGPDGASFAFVTVPVMNVGVYGVVMVLDAVATAREARAADHA
jgi:hypothetical protein